MGQAASKKICRLVHRLVAAEFIPNEFSERIYIDYISGIKNTINHTFKIYPNPSNGNFIIENLNGNEAISIIDVTGRIVKQIGSIDNPVIINDLSKGIYFVEVIAVNNSIYREQVIVE